MKVRQPSNPGEMVTWLEDGEVLTVGDIRNAIAYLDDDVEVSFDTITLGPLLSFVRFGWRGPKKFRFDLKFDEG